MKRLQTTIGAILCIVGFTYINSTNASAQVGIKYLGGVHGPPPTNVASSPSYLTFLSNRGQQMLGQIAGGYAPVGSARSTAIVEAMEYKKMVVTSTFESWQSELAPGSSEHGTMRYDEGFYVYINGGTFIPSQVTVNTKSQIWNGEGWSDGGGISVTADLGTVHAARIRMNTGTDSTAGNSNDQPHSVQSGSIASTGFVFIGPAVGGFAYGSGTNQQQMQNVINYYSNNRLRLVHTITVPSTLGTQVFTKINQVGPGTPVSDFQIVKTTNPAQLNLTWTANGSVSIVQRSDDLSSWTDLGTPSWYSPGQPVSVLVDVMPEHSRMFWRVKQP